MHVFAVSFNEVLHEPDLFPWESTCTFWVEYEPLRLVY